MVSIVFSDKMMPDWVRLRLAALMSAACDFGFDQADNFLWVK